MRSKIFFTRSPLNVRVSFYVTTNLKRKTRKQRMRKKRDLRGGNLKIWDGSVVNSQTTFLPEELFVRFLDSDVFPEILLGAKPVSQAY